MEDKKGNISHDDVYDGVTNHYKEDEIISIRDIKKRSDNAGSFLFKINKLIIISFAQIKR